MLQRILSLSVVIYFFMSASPAFSLTFEQTLALRKAGLSDKTIQMMLEQENKNPFDTESPNTWTTPDGRVFRSTGQGRRSTGCSDSFYPIDVYPIIRTFPRVK